MDRKESLSEDHAELIELVAGLIEKTAPELVGDPRVPPYILKACLHEALLDAFRTFIQERENGEQGFNMFMRGIVDSAVDALLLCQREVKQ